MMCDRTAVAPAPTELKKCPTGIHGLDIITGGGLPRGRPTLICGGTGSGKTLMAMAFLVHGIQQYKEPGVFMSFEERATDLAANVASLGYDLPALAAAGTFAIDQVTIDGNEVRETGEYDLDGLFIRLADAIDSIGAQRVVLDTIETLFAALTNTQIIRSELRRLFGWLKDKGVTAIVTGERGDGTLTRHGLEEYASDCVISLDQRVTDQIATRRMRVVKYRGSPHGTNEYPFLIENQGVTVLPITGIALNYPVSSEVVSTGISGLDAMFGGGGYFRGGSLLVSGAAGTGKTSIAAHFADAACRRGERCMYFAFEESPDQIVRNMRSIGLELPHWVEKGLLHFAAFRPSSFGLEVHLCTVLTLIDQIKPHVVAVDPISGLIAAGTMGDARTMLMRMMDLLKTRQITALLTSLTQGADPFEQSEVGVSSMIDSWLVLRNLEMAGERTRTLSIVKSRGMKHSNQTREFLLTDRGADLVDVFVGPDGGIMTGSVRAAQEATDHAAAVAMEQDIQRKQAAMVRKRQSVEARITELEADLAAEVAELGAAIEVQTSAASARFAARRTQARGRQGADPQSKWPDGGQG